MQFYICEIDIIYLAHTWTDNIVLPWEDTKLPFFWATVLTEPATWNKSNLNAIYAILCL